MFLQVAIKKKPFELEFNKHFIAIINIKGQITSGALIIAPIRALTVLEVQLSALVGLH